MLNDLMEGLVEIILDNYNQQNGTKIKLEKLNIDEIKKKAVDLIWLMLEKGKVK